MDVLDLKANQLLSREFEPVASRFPPDLLDLFATRDEPAPAHAPDEDQAACFRRT